MPVPGPTSPPARGEIYVAREERDLVLCVGGGVLLSVGCWRSSRNEVYAAVDSEREYQE
jgi:hypothetical protein